MLSIPNDPPAVLLKLLQFGPLAAATAIDTTEDWLLGLRLGLPVNGIGVGPLRVLSAVWKGDQASVEECYALGLKWSHFCKVRIPMVASWINTVAREGVAEIYQSKNRNTMVLWYEITARPTSALGKSTRKANLQLVWILGIIVVSIIVQAYGAIALSVLLFIQMLAVFNGMAGSSEVPNFDNIKQAMRYFVAVPNFSSDSLVLLQGRQGILEGTLNGALQYKSPRPLWKYVAAILVALQAIGVLYTTGGDGWDAVVTTSLLLGLWLLSQLGKDCSELWRQQHWQPRLIKKLIFPTRKSAWLYCGLQSDNKSDDRWFEHVLPLTKEVCLLLRMLATVRIYKPKTKAEFDGLYQKEGIELSIMKDFERDILIAYQEYIYITNSNRPKNLAEVAIIVH